MEGANNLQKKINQRNWDSPLTRGENSWTMFKVMSEFVDGFETLNKIGPCVSIFGSARTKPDNPYYKMASVIAKKLTEIGFGVITGGGPGSRTTSISIYIYKLFFQRSELGQSVALSFILLVISLTLLYFGLKLMK